jgi:hypothetical protein
MNHTTAGSGENRKCYTAGDDLVLLGGILTLWDNIITVMTVVLLRKAYNAAVITSI